MRYLWNLIHKMLLADYCFKSDVRYDINSDDAYGSFFHNVPALINILSQTVDHQDTEALQKITSIVVNWHLNGECRTPTDRLWPRVVLARLHSCDDVGGGKTKT